MEKVYFCPHCLGVFDAPINKVNARERYECTLQGCYKQFTLVDFLNIKRMDFSLYNKEMLETHIKQLYKAGNSIRIIAQEMKLKHTLVGTFTKKFNLLSKDYKQPTRKLENKIFLDLTFVKSKIKFRKPYIKQNIVRKLLALSFSRKAIYYFVNHAFCSVDGKVTYNENDKSESNSSFPWNTSYNKLDTIIKQSLALGYHKKPTYNLRDLKEKKLYVYFDDIFWQIVKYLSLKEIDYNITLRSEDDYLPFEKSTIINTLKKDVKRKVFTKKTILEYLHSLGLYLDMTNLEDMLSKYKLKMGDLQNLSMVYKLFINSNLKNIELFYTFDNEHKAKYLLNLDKDIDDEQIKVPLNIFKNSKILKELKDTTLNTFINNMEQYSTLLNRKI